MNERQSRVNRVEMMVEKKIDRLDAAFTRDGSEMSQEEYDARMREIRAWEEAQYRAIQ